MSDVSPEAAAAVDPAVPAVEQPAAPVEAAAPAEPVAEPAVDAEPEPQPEAAAPVDAPVEDDTAVDQSSPDQPRFLIVVPVGSVISKPDYVDVIELRDNTPPPIVHHFWG